VDIDACGQPTSNITLAGQQQTILLWDIFAHGGFPQIMAYASNASLQTNKQIFTLMDYNL